MPSEYTGDDVPEDEPVTVTKECREPAGCGESFEVEIDPDGSYDAGIFFGEIEVPVDGATVVSETFEYDEWIGKMSNVTWSETTIDEFWMHEECAKPDDYDPGEADRSVA